MRPLTFIAGFLFLSALLFSQQAPQNADSLAPDEPGRPVARLSVLSGEASVRRGDSGEWVAAALNAPLMAGDSVSVGAGGAVEIQLDNAHFARLAGDSEARIPALESGRYQLQLAKGLVTYRILRESAAQTEIGTPLVAVHPLRQGSVRVEVAPDGSTRVIARHGEAEVNTPKGTEHVREGNMMLARGAADNPEFQVEYASAADAWDNWSDQRDAYLLRAQSPQYVSQDVYGTEDLDNYGHWSYDPAYGNVWAPTVPATWAPYRNGRWVWEDYYGWTWVDYDPWGWAPFHYGSWYYRTGFGWNWFPGHRYEHFWWRPALVGFFGYGGGFGVGFGFGNVGWIPLAPFERFHPWYGRGWNGRGGFNNGTIVNIRNTNIVNTYRNARFSGGVTAVSANDFQRGNFRNPVTVDRAQLQQASLVRGAVPLTPGAENARFSNAAGPAAGPRADLTNQRFFSRSGVATASPARTSAAPGWQRFGGTQGAAPQSAPSGARSAYAPPSRSLQVAPPIVRQREAAPQSYGGPSYGRNSGNFGEPAYRSAPPAYRSAPPAYRSAPPASRGGGGGNGGGGNGGGGSAPAGRTGGGGGGGGGNRGNSGGHNGHR